MNSNLRGLIIFASVLLTIGFWMPLSNSPRLAPTGGTITETYFGVFRYATMEAFMKEPDFSLKWRIDPMRLAITIAITTVFWFAVAWFLRRSGRSAADRAETQ